MIKLQSIPHLQASLPLFSVEDNFNLLYNRFLDTDLGKIFIAIPWEELIRSFKLKENKKGPDCIFSPQGKLALMILKHYAGCSDKKLIEQFNANIHYQFFCSTVLSLGQHIDNYKIVSQIRCELSGKLNIKDAQGILATHWLPHMEELDQILTDATCYESSVRFPTNQKLLWESVDWVFGQLRLMCKYAGVKVPRTKFLKWKERYWSYSRKRRKPSKEKTTLTRGLLKLLRKLIDELDDIEKNNEIEMAQKYRDRKHTVGKVLEQQQGHFETGEKIKNAHSEPVEKLHTSHCQGERNQKGRIWGQAQQVANKRHKLYRAPGFQCV